MYSTRTPSRSPARAASTARVTRSRSTPFWSLPCCAVGRKRPGSDTGSPNRPHPLTVTPMTAERTRSTLNRRCLRLVINGVWISLVRRNSVQRASKPLSGRDDASDVFARLPLGLLICDAHTVIEANRVARDLLGAALPPHGRATCCEL